MMGVSICSKFPLTSEEKLLFKNPHLTFKKDENRTYISHDKGFIVATIDEFNLVVASGHCLPFHIFEKQPTDYLEIFNEFEDRFMPLIKNKRVAIAGDFNYPNVQDIFPMLVKITEEIPFTNNVEEVQIDHILIDKDIKYGNNEILKTRFDHNLFITEINV
jgi:endonuclease/exonuclease/phosphatase family metal-dependent hydrolase